MNLKFPIILYCDNIFSVDNKNTIKFMKISFPQKNRMVCREHLIKHVPGWIIDSAGKFIELNPIGKRREWTRTLGFLWNWVLSEYEVTEPRLITIGEMKNIMKPLKDKFSGAGIAKAFRKHLNKYKDDEMLSEQILRDWPI